MLECSKHPEKPDIPAFCTGVSRYLFLCRYSAILFAMILKKTLPSTLSRAIGRNWLMFTASFSFGIKIPPALRHALGIALFCHAVLMSLQRNLRTSGAFLYTLYGTPFGPEADAVRARWTVFSTSFQVSGPISRWCSGEIGGMSDGMVKYSWRLGSEWVVLKCSSRSFFVVFKALLFFFLKSFQNLKGSL